MKHLGTWYVLIARVRGLVFRAAVLDASSAGRIGALIRGILVAERRGAGAAGGGEQRWHGGRFRGQIVVPVAGQRARLDPLVVGLGACAAKLVLHDDRVPAAGELEVRVQVAELETGLPLGRGQVEETRPRRRCPRGIAGVADVVERRRIDYVSGRCVWLGIRYLGPDRALVGVGCLRLAGRRRRVHARMLLQSFCNGGHIIISLRSVLSVFSFSFFSVIRRWSFNQMDRAPHSLSSFFFYVDEPVFLPRAFFPSLLLGSRLSFFIFDATHGSLIRFSTGRKKVWPTTLVDYSLVWEGIDLVSRQESEEFLGRGIAVNARTTKVVDMTN